MQNWMMGMRASTETQLTHEMSCQICDETIVADSEEHVRLDCKAHLRDDHTQVELFIELAKRTLRTVRQ
jgi:hypothetical protein